MIGLFQTATLGLLVLAGFMSGRGFCYHAGLTVAALLALYQQWLIRHRNREACFRAFLNNNWFGLAVFAGLLTDYLG